MYRPTVRYDDIFKDYIDKLFHKTHLDRNQILRAALFSAAYSKEFQSLMNEYKKKDVSLPLPLWGIDQHAYWMEQKPEIKERGKDVNVKHGGKKETSINHGINQRRSEPDTKNEQHRRIEPTPRRSREISAERITIREKGGITIKIN